MPDWSDRMNDALDVSGAFDNCFFHALSAHFIANKIRLPTDLFTFKSLLGENSLASQLQKRFKNERTLSSFARVSQYSKQANPQEFLVEKTLVLGFLFREYFATQMVQMLGQAQKMKEDTLQRFKSYVEFRRAFTGPEILLSGPEGVLYASNQAFLEGI